MKVLQTKLKKIDLTLDKVFEIGNRIKSKQMVWQFEIPKGTIKLFIKGIQVEENGKIKTEYYYSFTKLISK